MTLTSAAVRALAVLDYLSENQPDCYGWGPPYPSTTPGITQEANALRKAITLATAEAASGAGEREGLTWRLERIIDDGGPLTLSDKAVLREARAALASLTPATDPAISGLSSFPPNWKLRQMHFSAPCADDRKWHVNVYGGREGGDTFVGRGTSADEALRDAARNACTALAAAPTIPATGEAVPKPLRVDWNKHDLAEAYDLVEGVRSKMAQSPESPLDTSLRAALDAIEAADCEWDGLTKATMPATGEAGQ